MLQSVQIPSNQGMMILTQTLNCTYLSISIKECKHITKFHKTISSSLKSNSNSTIQHSPTVSHLINKYGLPLDSAISASQNLTTEALYSVLQLFQTYGFTQTHITKIITKFPKLIHVKTLKPKLEYFESLGLSKSDIAEMVYLYNKLLCKSLKAEIIPTFNFIKTFSEDAGMDFTAVLKSYSLVANAKINFDLTVKPNIIALQNYGVPGPNICKLFVFRPKVLRLKNNQFEEIVRVVYEMKFDPLSLSFVLAVGTMGSISKLSWEEKLDAYKSFGWTEEEFVSAYKLQPQCMSISEEKIRKMMAFYLNELGLTASDICKYPNLMLVSLEKRIIPRCSVLLVLLSYGLIEKDFKLMAVLNQTNERFEKKYLNKHPEIAPKLLDAYQGELGYPKLEKLRAIL